jgi:hypothetical protein
MKPRNSRDSKLSVQYAVVIAILGFLLGLVCNQGGIVAFSASNHEYTTNLMIDRNLEESEEISEGIDLTSVSYIFNYYVLLPF